MYIYEGGVQKVTSNTAKITNHDMYLSSLLTLARCCWSNVNAHDCCCFRCVTFARRH